MHRIASPFLSLAALLLRRTLQRLFLFGNHGQLCCHFCIEFREGSPFLRYIVFMENRFHRTLGNARFTVDAFIRMDVKHFFAFVKALHRADDNAIRVLAVKTGFGNDVGHDESLSV